MSALPVVLLPVAGVLGWLFGRSYREVRRDHTLHHFRQNYYQGLNYLINEQPDKAIDIFTQLFETDHETIEMHLAVGNLFRRRGEIERAIRIHQNLIGRPEVAKQHRVHALAELGYDYLHIGMLSRAERLFLELVQMREHEIPSLKALLNIYEQQKEWREAIMIADKLIFHGQTMNVNIAHYFCELAEIALQKNEWQQAHDYLKKALTADRQCARASLIEGRMAMSARQYKLAIRAYERIPSQLPDYISETIMPLAECYANCQNEADFIAYLRQCLLKYRRASIMLALCDYLNRYQSSAQAIDFILQQVHHYPSLRGLQRLIELYALNTQGENALQLAELSALVKELLKQKSMYRCEQCGFATNTLFWLCPGCRTWSAIRPSREVSSE